MKTEAVNMHSWLLLTLAAAFVLGFGAGAEAQQNKFRLKPGAQGKICLNCHTAFQEKLKRPFLHTPVKAGECTGCHDPHASGHAKMLAAETNKVCFKCHAGVLPGKALSIHKVAAEGNCIKCHDPHAAKNRSNLPVAGNELCFECHKDLGAFVAKVKFRHNPVEKGCVTCHSPHASVKSVALLAEAVPDLCLRCHKPGTPSFKKQHMNYPVERKRCTGCHNPHGSDRAGMLLATVHRPVAGKMCNQCHEESGSPNPFATRRAGLDLCRGCHSNMINEALGKNRIHWPAVDKTGCVRCHNPHASTAPALLKAPQTNLCGECHADSLERMKRSDTKHPPVQEGLCTTCHEAHASNSVFLFRQAAITDVCRECHDFRTHQTHPIGPKIVDPRNRNATVSCPSCHATHGTENKHMLYYPTATELCVQCHAQYRR